MLTNILACIAIHFAKSTASEHIFVVAKLLPHCHPPATQFVGNMYLAGKLVSGEITGPIWLKFIKKMVVGDGNRFD